MCLATNLGCAVASAAITLAPTVELVVVLRALQGVAGAFLVATVVRQAPSGTP